MPVSLILETRGTLRSSPSPYAKLQLNINSGLSPPLSLSPPRRFTGCIYFAYSRTQMPPCLMLKKSSCFLVFTNFAWVPAAAAPSFSSVSATCPPPLGLCTGTSSVGVFFSCVLSPYFFVLISPSSLFVHHV